MACTEIIILTTDSRDAARDALREVRRLDREGWVDLTGYARVDSEKSGDLHVREASDCAEAACLATTRALTAALLECLKRATGGVLLPASSAVIVLAEQRYAERVAAEFETRGATSRRALPNDQCELVLRASVETIQGKIAWLVELLENEGEKMARSHGVDRERVETGIRAARTELGRERVHLQARLAALRTELETQLPGNQLPGNQDAAPTRPADEIEREIADINEDLALSILDHLDALAGHAAELRERIAREPVAEAAATGEQLDELDMHMRKYRADLTATLAASATLSRNCSERLRKTGVETTLQEHMKKLEQRHALLKADIQQLQREDSRSWRGLTAGFRETWRSLRGTLDEARVPASGL